MVRTSRTASKKSAKRRDQKKKLDPGSVVASRVDVIKKSLKIPVQDDTELLTKQIRALITTNVEIMEQCQDGHVAGTTSYERTTLSIIKARNGNMEAMAIQKFERRENPEYYRIHTPYLPPYCMPQPTQPKPPQYLYDPCNVTTNKWLPLGHLIFRAEEDVEVLDFDFIPDLPGVLTDLVPVEKRSNITDFDGEHYEDLLKRSLFLHQDLQPAFMSKLKEHLEEIQILLGTIHQWLLEAQDYIDFIKLHFGNTSVLKSGEAKDPLARYSNGKFPPGLNIDTMFDITIPTEKKKLVKLLAYARE